MVSYRYRLGEYKHTTHHILIRVILNILKKNSECLGAL